MPKPNAAATSQFTTILDVANDEEVLRTGHTLEMRDQARDFLKDPSAFTGDADKVVHFLSELRYFDDDIEGGVIRRNPSDAREMDAWVDSLKSTLAPNQEIKMPKGSQGPNVGGAWSLGSR